MTEVTLVIGASAAAREAAIAGALAPGVAAALILEGVPATPAPLEETEHLRIARIAPGCPCCTGNMTMRITLNRMLRPAPPRLYISLATSQHLEQIRHFLSNSPYDKLLQLTKDLHA